MGHRSADASAAFATGKKLMEGSDCMACHAKEKKSVGPTLREVSKKYNGDATALEKLTKKVIAGGSGVWGDVAMAGHPQLATADAAEMVKYILNINNEKPKEKSLPVNGTYTTKLPSGDKDKGKGVYIVRASYEDQGANGLPSLKSEQTFVLRNAKVDAHGFDEYVDINKMAFGGNNLAIPSKSGAYTAIKQIDLNGLSELQLLAIAPKPQLNAVGGIVELHLGSPTGKLIGTSKFLEPSDKMDFKPNVLSIPINLSGVETNKLQDVYAEFLNPKSEGQSLMLVMGFDFKMANEGETVAVPKVEASAANADFYAGQWTTTFIGTPQGDAELLLNLVRNNGKLEGTIAAKADNKAITIDKIEETPEKLTLYFKMMGFDLNLTLEKEDNDNLKGSLMGMFKTKAVRIK
jgi:cytochrome c